MSIIGVSWKLRCHVCLSNTQEISAVVRVALDRSENLRQRCENMLSVWPAEYRDAASLVGSPRCAFTDVMQGKGDMGQRREQQQQQQQQREETRQAQQGHGKEVTGSGDHKVGQQPSVADMSAAAAGPREPSSLQDGAQAGYSSGNAAHRWPGDSCGREGYKVHTEGSDSADDEDAMPLAKRRRLLAEASNRTPPAAALSAERGGVVGPTRMVHNGATGSGSPRPSLAAALLPKAGDPTNRQRLAMQQAQQQVRQPAGLQAEEGSVVVVINDSGSDEDWRWVAEVEQQAASAPQDQAAAAQAISEPLKSPPPPSAPRPPPAPAPVTSPALEAAPAPAPAPPSGATVAAAMVEDDMIILDDDEEYEHDHSPSLPARAAAPTVAAAAAAARTASLLANRSNPSSCAAEQKPPWAAKREGGAGAAASPPSAAGPATHRQAQPLPTSTARRLEAAATAAAASRAQRAGAGGGGGVGAYVFGDAEAARQFKRGFTLTPALNSQAKRQLAPTSKASIAKAARVILKEMAEESEAKTKNAWHQAAMAWREANKPTAPEVEEVLAGRGEGGRQWRPAAAVQQEGRQPGGGGGVAAARKPHKDAGEAEWRTYYRQVNQAKVDGQASFIQARAGCICVFLCVWGRLSCFLRMQALLISHDWQGCCRCSAPSMCPAPLRPSSARRTAWQYACTTQTPTARTGSGAVTQGGSGWSVRRS
jgi:hypothetical protein